MATGTRIPRGIHDFNVYLPNTTAYLLTGSPTNSVRLGITPEEMTQWSVFTASWEPLYAKYSDKKNTRTTAVTDQLRGMIADVISFDQNCHFIDRIAASANVTIVDLEIFNIKKGPLQKVTRMASSTPIAEQVSVTFGLLGGGMINIKCYSTTGQRASIYSGADGVQYMFVVGNTPPESAEVPGLSKELSTRAIITLSLGAGNAGKNLYIYFRWYNSKHPELSGPWSALQTTIIV